MIYILVTHDDMDGGGSEISFRVHMRDQNFVAIHSSIEDISAKVIHLTSDPNHSPDRAIIFFADITPPLVLLDSLILSGYKVYRFDHHPTAAVCDGLAPESQLELNGVESGTSLLDRFLRQWPLTAQSSPKSKRYDEFIENIRDWDTWAWAKTNDMRAKNLVNLFWLLGIDRFVKLYVDRWTSSDETDSKPVIQSEHMLFIEAKLDTAKEIIEATSPAKVLTCSFLGYKTAITFAGAGFSFSDGSYRFLSQYRDYDLMLNVNLARRSVGIRTIRDDLDVGALVTQFGGGGHPKAAGFPINYDQLTDIMTTIMRTATN